MRVDLNRWFIVVAATGCLLGSKMHSVFGNELPKQLIEALEHNSAALSPLTLKWTEKRSSRLPLEEFLELTHQPDEKAFFEPQMVTVKLQESAFSVFRRESQWDKKKGTFFTWFRDCRFDGALLYTGNSMNPRPLVTVQDLTFLASHYPNANQYFADYLTAAGFRVHNRNGTIGNRPESEILYLAASGYEIGSVREKTTGTDPLLEVELAGKDERVTFLLNRRMQYAVRAIKRSNHKGELIQAVVNSEFFELRAPQLWLPAQSVVTDYTWWTIPNEVFTDPLVLTGMEVEVKNRDVIPESEFVIELKPGTRVFDSRPEAASMLGAIKQETGQYSYRIKPTDEAIAESISVSRGRSRSIILIILNVIAVVAIVTILVLTRRK